MSARFVLVAIVCSILGGASPALAEGFQPVSVSQLAGAPEEFEGEVITGGYLQLIGYAHFSEGDGKYENDVISVTYKMWESPDFQGSSIFVVIEDKNKADFEDNLPMAPAIIEGAYYQLQGDWHQRVHVASPEVSPGSPVWALRAYGFD